MARVRYELLVGLRYTRAKRRNHFISFISIASMLGIAVGVWALIVVLSVMNGFQKEVRARILGAVAHVQISGEDNRLANWEEVAREASANPEVTAAAPYVNGQGLLMFGSSVRGVVVRGVVPELEQKVVEIGMHMVAGRLDSLVPGEFGIVLGTGLARALGANVGNKITLIAPQGLVTPAGIVPRVKQFTVTGIFRIDYSEYDSGLALVHLADAQKLYGMGDAVTGVRLKLKDLYKSREVTRDLFTRLRGDLYISDWTRSNANYFRAVQIEKTMMFIILLLIVLVAAFNSVSTLVMAVTDKQADIAILRTLGASPGGIMKIFIIQGAVIGLLGTFLGVASGIPTALNIDVIVPFLERLFGIHFLSSEVYYITELPSDLQRGDVIAITLVSLALSLIATLYPSWRAARVNPAEALRYE
ncbi:MAG TPA: lipoprotein-releasing ABC transporter permease subunit [Burkholderiales bacterium]|nr:lipoprotein-releasing ABC transporter permease subunit [Burkholderiales bacterium]HYA47695.1 lipoprotein-releasing ABC transporter permease subunit [Burkholderiales bacterium]